MIFQNKSTTMKYECLRCKPEWKNREKWEYYKDLKYNPQFPNKVWLEQTGIYIPCFLLGKEGNKIGIRVQKPLINEHGFLGPTELVCWDRGIKDGSPQQYKFMDFVLYGY